MNNGYPRGGQPNTIEKEGNCSQIRCEHVYVDQICTSIMAFPLFLICTPVLASPTNQLLAQNSTLSDSRTHGFLVPGPNGRGTLTIIFSSWATLFTCVWTAMHLNVQNHNKLPDLKDRLSRRAWLPAAIIVPEFAFLYALCQWINASSLQKKINALGGRAAERFQSVGFLEKFK